MTFKNLDDFKKYILFKSKDAIHLMQERVYDVISKFLSQFYKEFEPEVYVRTEQLLRSLVKTRIINHSNGYFADVYFDLDKLDYSHRAIPAQFSHLKSSQNTYHRENWTKDNDAWVLSNAMEGQYVHGGYIGANKNTAIWIETLKVLDDKNIDLLKKSLIDAGISVK